MILAPLKKQLFPGPLSLLYVAILAPHANFDPINGHMSATCVISKLYLCYICTWFFIRSTKQLCEQTIKQLTLIK